MATVNAAEFHDDFLGEMANGFETGAVKLNEALEKALKELQSDPSNPALLASYQAALGSYTVFRNVQTNTVKAFKDIDMSIIQAAR